MLEDSPVTMDRDRQTVGCPRSEPVVGWCDTLPKTEDVFLKRRVTFGISFSFSFRCYFCEHNVTALHFIIDTL